MYYVYGNKTIVVVVIVIFVYSNTAIYVQNQLNLECHLQNFAAFVQARISWYTGLISYQNT